MDIKVGTQYFVMIIIAILVHFILSGQLVLFGSIYHFGNQHRQLTGDVIYVQDKKVVTQKITEYTKINNLQNDIASTAEEVTPTMLYVVSGMVDTGNILYVLQTSSYRARALTNDGLLFVAYIDPLLQGNRNVISQEGNIYPIKHRYIIEGKPYGLLRLDITQDKELLSKIVDVVSYKSPFLLGQWYLQIQNKPYNTQIALCHLIQVSHNTNTCQEFVGTMKSDVVFSLYGNLVGVYQQNNILPVTKEQFQQRLEYIEKYPNTDRIPLASYVSQFIVIDNILRKQYNLKQTQGRWVRSVDPRDGFVDIKTGDIIAKISGIGPVSGRDVSSLLQGMKKQDIVFQR